jgi:hypothetical protein
MIRDENALSKLPSGSKRNKTNRKHPSKVYSTGLQFCWVGEKNNNNNKFNIKVIRNLVELLLFLLLFDKFRIAKGRIYLPTVAECSITYYTDAPRGARVLFTSSLLVNIINICIMCIYIYIYIYIYI